MKKSNLNELLNKARKMRVLDETLEKILKSQRSNEMRENRFWIYASYKKTTN